MMAAVARQWFGAFMRPRAASDQWLIVGLAGWLEGQIVKGFQGRTELLYRSGPAPIGWAHHPHGRLLPPPRLTA